ncbi:GNAT family N-acetyltransferase [Mesorhizobium sp. YIM 152430]|uniref:GNAT family N-acetyltransferase n=1 Tax=Mesorhizobium sp. YIM 152430 TaxID=3031761 RepID=UPI0023D9F072|nr:GNAT family N-acetyltransferase [Mesorhizobium sp. YIM 152430]MDF1599151.1 GNAT family N-acetyltransferase [Mesorhizobium sp. YIM 152430]
MGGAHVADYTGAVCAPQFAQAAMSAFAKHLRKMNWANLHLDNLRMSSGRMRSFIENLEDRRLDIRNVTAVNKADNIDNSICPSIELPATWDAYLEEKVGANTRQKLRRLLRKLDGSDEFRITLPDSATLDRDIGILLGFWRDRWGTRKGNRMPGILRTNQRTFQDAFSDGCLFFPVLWQGERPLGALATFIDPVKKTYLFSMAGRDETVQTVSPGLLLHAFSIRHAIENGFRTYDFLRGNEPYKYMLGATDTIIGNKRVYTRSGRNLGDKLDVRLLSGIFKAANGWHKDGLLVKAERAYRQILDTDPLHATTLYALGQFVASKGDHQAAATIFQTLSSVAPELAKGWTRLGTALQALGRHGDAVEAFGKAIQLTPDSASARYGVAVSLFNLGCARAAKAQLEAVLQMHSGSGKMEPQRVKAALLLQELNQSTLPNFARNGASGGALPIPSTSTSVPPLTFR